MCTSIRISTIAWVVALYLIPNGAFGKGAELNQGNDCEAVGMAKLFSQAYKHCMSSPDASGGVTVALLDCKQDELAVQDKMLNDAFKRLTKRYKDPDLLKRLRSNEGKWIKARDAVCDSESADAGDGTLSSVAYMDCMLRMTTLRVRTLKLFEEVGAF